MISNAFEKIKIDFEKYKITCKGKTPILSCNKNEFIEIQKRVDVLDTTLKKCAFDLNKFASRFPKGITKGKHTHHQHARKHAHMYGSGKIYVCTHCGRKGHLEKFCFAKLNMTNKYVWVRPGTNPKGPKKIWVPKDTLNLVDTGGSSSSKT